MEGLSVLFLVLIVVGAAFIGVINSQDKDLEKRRTTEHALEEERRMERIYAEEKKRAHLIAEGYTFSKEISTLYSVTRQNVIIDDNKKVVIFDDGIIQYKDIIATELITKESQSSTTLITRDGAAGRAVVGGILAGGVGAIVGASSAASTGSTTTSTLVDCLGVRIFTSNVMSPMLEVFADSQDKQFSTDLYATILAIIAQTKLTMAQ